MTSRRRKHKKRHPKARHTSYHAVKPKRDYRKYWVWVGLLIILAFSMGVRIRLLSVPLERDEGAYAYMGQLILQGVPPYAESHDVKMPGLYAAYALILALFGHTHTAIHLGLLLLNAATIVLLFMLARRLFGNLSALVTAAAFAILSLGRPVQGLFANAEHFVILPAVAGLVLLLWALDRNRIWAVFLSGAILGIAFIIKQPGAAFVAVGGLSILYHQLRIRPVPWTGGLSKCVLFAVGAILPFALCCLMMFATGTFEKFWFWTFTYPTSYVSAVSLSRGLTLFKLRIVPIIKPSILLWCLAGIGLSAVVWSRKARHHALLLITFSLFSFLSICPGLYFRPHYFVLLLPAVALLTGAAVAAIAALLPKSYLNLLLAAVTLFVLLEPVYKQRKYLFKMTPLQVCRATYFSNPFPESLPIAEYIRERSSESDTIAVLGSEPQIYVYSRRRAATYYTTTYPIMGSHEYAQQMQNEMIEQIETARPKFIVLVRMRTSWITGPSSESVIADWSKRYLSTYYKTVGVIDIIPAERTDYIWGDQALTYSPKSRGYLVVLQRLE